MKNFNRATEMMSVFENLIENQQFAEIYIRTLAFKWKLLKCVHKDSKYTSIYFRPRMNSQYTHGGCLFSAFREEALNDVLWCLPTGLPPPPAQYQSSAEGCYQHGDAPPTARGSPYHPTHNLARTTAQTLFIRRTNSHPQHISCMQKYKL